MADENKGLFGNKTHFRMESVDRGQVENPYVTGKSRATGTPEYKYSVSSQNPKDSVNASDTTNGKPVSMRIPLTIKLFRKGLVWVSLLNDGTNAEYVNETEGSIAKTTEDYNGKRLLGGMYMDQSRVSLA